MPDIEKGQHTTLNVTQKARHRVFAGLGWDPKEKASLMEKAKELIGGPKTWHDLDLSCFIYDTRKSFIQSVTAETGSHINESGAIYHSGDNEEGIGDGDDEQISAELKDMDENIGHLVFIATIKSGHTFGDITAPTIRLVDGYSGHEFLSAPLDTKDGSDKVAFVFAHIYRNALGQWMLHYIGEFLNVEGTQSRPAIVAAYLTNGDSEVKDKAS